MNLKTTFPSLLIALFCLLSACQVDQLEPVDMGLEEDKLVLKKEETTTQVSLSHHGFYVNDFYTANTPEETILGYPDKEDELLDWAQFHEFGSIALYDIRNVLMANNSQLLQQLENFIAKAKTQYNLDVVFSAGGVDGIERMDEYCAAHLGNPDHMPTGIVTEYEFWNPGNSFSEYRVMLKILKKMIADYQLERSFLYISRFEDEEYGGGSASFANSNTSDGNNTTTSAGMCPAQVMYVILNTIRQVGEDKLYISLVNYRTNAPQMPSPNSNYYDRLQKIATMASASPSGIILVPSYYDCSYGTRLNMHVNLALIFNVRQDSSDPNIFNYFNSDPSTMGLDNDFKNAYLNFVEEYEQSAITNKDRMLIEGNQIYRYSDAKVARPM